MQKSLRLVLQSKSVYEENWMDRIKIVQENGAYHLRTRDEEILLLKKTIAKDGYPIVVYSVSNFLVTEREIFPSTLEILMKLIDYCCFVQTIILGDLTF